MDREGTSERRSEQRSVQGRILIISGDPVLRERLYALLTRHGYLVRTDCSGKIAAETLLNERPDLIVANSAADTCGGWGIAEHIRRFDDLLPIVLLIHPDQEPLDTRTIRDVQAHLPHDVSERELIAIVNRWVPLARSAAPIRFPGPILIIDDEPEALRSLKAFLQLRGCTVVTECSGEEALTQLACHHPTLVLLDIKMPGMDGLLTLKKIKTARPDLPVVIATAVQDQEVLAQAFALGAVEYLTKPYSFRELESLLRYLKQLIQS